jgi:hypothetical protein
MAPHLVLAARLGRLRHLRRTGEPTPAPALIGHRRHRERCHRGRLRRSALAVPLAGVMIGAGGASAQAETVVNYTFHVPAQIETNPCFPGDVVNLNGDIHIVITSTADGSGGYHMNTSLNSQLTGTSITTQTDYVNQENKQTAWYAGVPFPTVYSSTYDFDLVSKAGTPNYVMRMQMHDTVTANGMSVPAVDHVWVDCRG